MGFHFESSLRNHSNILFVQEINLNELPQRIKGFQPLLSKAFLCRVQVYKTQYKLVICEPVKFPRKLPYLFLYSPEKHDFHNHVNYTGEICYTDKDRGLLINTEKPEAVLFQSIDLSIDVLKSSYERDLKDLLEEFEGYWRSLPDDTSMDSFHYPNSTVSKIKIITETTKSRKTIPLAAFSVSLPEEYAFKRRLVGKQSRNGWFIPLGRASLPPNPDAGLSSKYVKRLLQFANPAERGELFKQIEKKESKKNKKAKYRTDFIIFSQPRPSGNIALFGVLVSGYSKTHFFLDKDPSKWNATPINIKRHYPEYLVERGGAHKSLNDMNIAICGCGAVGSRIAEQLALSGIRNFILIDDDILSADNIYRHVLGSEYIDFKKVDAMADHLRRRLPYINVIPEPIAREYWIAKNGYEKADLIFDATADLTGIREMNRQFFEMPVSPPIIYCWLEACGIGGHAILVDHISTGCLECLIERNKQGMYFKSSFLMPFQKISKDLTGCGSGFTPFSAIDAIKTATIASELAFEYIFYHKKSCYKFWVGSDLAAKEEKLLISDWYHTAVSKGNNCISDEYFRPSCPICRRPA